MVCVEGGFDGYAIMETRVYVVGLQGRPCNQSD